MLENFIADHAYMHCWGWKGLNNPQILFSSSSSLSMRKIVVLLRLHFGWVLACVRNVGWCLLLCVSACVSDFNF